MPYRCAGVPVSLTLSRPVLGRVALSLAVALTSAPAIVLAGPTAPVLAVPERDSRSSTTEIVNETVPLMVGLIGIERDLLLGQLFLKDGLVSTEGSHFTHPRQDSLPAIKDGLAKAGAPDLETLLIALEEAGDKEAVMAAYTGVLGGLQKAKTAIAPTEQDVLSAVVMTAEAAASILDPSGTTEVVAYQEAWGLLMAARGNLGALTSSSDPAIRKLAESMALAFDDVILFAPDPAATAPVAFDPALVLDLVKTLQGQVASI